MLFNSLTFVVFFLVVLGTYRMLPTWRSKKWLLLVASYLFYGAWSPPFVLLLAISTAVDWVVARRMHAAEAPGRRKQLLGVSLGVNLGFLAFFKYGGFLQDNFIALMHAAGVDYEPALPDIVLPVGISFYTFQTLSYTLDIYRRQLEPHESLLDFALFVSFFPQLVAGPIVRAADFLPQCRDAKRIEGPRLGWGLFLMTVGLFEKVVLADGLLADTADSVFGNPGPVWVGDAWLGVIAFAGQIFCDFAGYSTCAIGAALCFGFALPDNFRFPYAAVGLRDFWRRWHISLSTWLRDYLYIPLGGNRHGRLNTAWALGVTMLLGGLWHGASWNFVIWGALHGIYLMGERALVARLGDAAWTRTRPARFVAGVITFGLVCLAWVFFRAENLERAGMQVAAMLGVIPVGPILPTINIVEVLVTMAAIVSTHIALRNRSLEDLAASTPSWLLTLAWAAMFGAIILMQGAGDAFIYFQF